jgi:4-hydroxyacetophenone monooxygenase
VGQLNRPSVPKIRGLDDFEGPMFHTARWDSGVDLKGKRVAMIGTGASAMQAGPSIAPDVAHLRVFQRTPHWAMNNPNYHRAVSAGNAWALERIPYFSNWLRFQLFWASSDGFHASLHADPSWTSPAISLNEANHKMRELIVDYVRGELDGDERLLAKVIPGYPPYGKRMLRDNHWYRMLKRGNVALETDPISHVTEDAIVMKDGTVHPADVIILATGFQASRMLWPLDIRGAAGTRSAATGATTTRAAYLGIAAPNYPNLFLVYGPNTNLAHGGSIIFHTECQVRYIAQALREMVERGYGDRGGAPGRPRPLQPPPGREGPGHGLGAPGRDELVQERPQPPHGHLALAAARLLGHDPALRARRVPGGGQAGASPEGAGAAGGGGRLGRQPPVS